MQRERKQDVAGWLWPAAATIVLSLYLAFLAALAWGVHRVSLAPGRMSMSRWAAEREHVDEQRERDRADQQREPAPQ